MVKQLLVLNLRNENYQNVKKSDLPDLIFPLKYQSFGTVAPQINSCLVLVGDVQNVQGLKEDLNIHPKFNDKDILLEAYRSYSKFFSA